MLWILGKKTFKNWGSITHSSTETEGGRYKKKPHQFRAYVCESKKDGTGKR